MATIWTNVLDMEVNNDVAVALIGHGYNEWEWFQSISIENFDDLKKYDGNYLIFCTYEHRRTIELFIEYKRHKLAEKDPNSPWKDVVSYTANEFEQFYFGTTSCINELKG